MKKLIEYLPDFVSALKFQIELDQLRWGDTWLQRPQKGQVDRVMARFRDYQDQHNNGNQEFPWLKVAGEALIGYVRDKYPSEFPDEMPR